MYIHKVMKASIILHKNLFVMIPVKSSKHEPFEICSLLKYIDLYYTVSTGGFHDSVFA